jgi:hypothetical protein
LQIPLGGFPISTIRRIAIAVVLSLVLAVPTSAQTRQIVQNGGFESCVSEWTVNQGDLNHTTATVHTGSGSAETTIHPQWGASDVVQCIDVSTIIKTWPAPDGIERLTLSGYVNATATTISMIRMEAHFYSGLGCGELLQWYAAPSISSPTAGWVKVSGTTTIPARTKSIGIHLYAEGSGGETVCWDDVEAYSDADNGLLYSLEEAETLVPTVLPICVAVAALAGFGLLWLMKQGRR